MKAGGASPGRAACRRVRGDAVRCARRPCAACLGRRALRPRVLAVACAALALAGCGGPQDFMHPAGPGARGLAGLGWIAIAAFSVTTVAVWLLIAWAANRRRGSFDWHAPAESGGGQRWIVIGGVAIPVAVLTVLFIASLQTLAGYPLAHAKMDEPDIRVIGHQWWFDALYLPGGSIATDAPGDTDLVKANRRLGERADLTVHAPTEIHIPVGRPIEIELVTRDVIHSFWVPKLHGKEDLIPGQANRIRIQADRPGLYQGECAEYCGVQHAHMRLQIVAQPPDEFDAWLAHQRAAAQPSADREVERGRQVFETAACALCHTVRGTRAHGSVGPELTHVGSRAFIAGGTLRNDTANLAAWITDAQSLKPGAQMPSLRQFKGPELRALVAYLQSLK